MKLTQKKCSSKLPNTKSAKALSCEMLSKSALFSGLVWMRRDAVRTNWPTQALKPERNALKGCSRVSTNAQTVNCTRKCIGSGSVEGARTKLPTSTT